MTRHRKTKIKKEQYRLLVKKAKALHHEEGIPLKMIGIRFGVSASTVSHAMNGQYPKWYQDELKQK